MNFFNSISLGILQRKRAEQDVQKQNQQILNCFLDINKPMTPFQVLSELGLENVPITSIRRGITTLTKKGFLIKTDAKVVERYGKVNHLWKINLERKSYGN